MDVMHMEVEISISQCHMMSHGNNWRPPPTCPSQSADLASIAGTVGSSSGTSCKLQIVSSQSTRATTLLSLSQAATIRWEATRVDPQFQDVKVNSTQFYSFLVVFHLYTLPFFPESAWISDIDIRHMSDKPSSNVSYAKALRQVDNCSNRTLPAHQKTVDI